MAVGKIDTLPDNFQIIIAAWAASRRLISPIYLFSLNS
jgi:hypothetical protein